MYKEAGVKSFIESERTSLSYLSNKFTECSSAFQIDYFPQKESIGFKINAEKRTKTNTFSFGEYSVEISVELSHILEELNYSKYILELSYDNWDDDGAVAITESVYQSAVDFLARYSQYLFSAGVIIDVPEINPLIDGSIDLSWRTKEARLLVNFKTMVNEKVGELQITGKFFGDSYSPLTNKYGFIDMLNFDFSFAEWMKKLKK